jgi:hypothetical protein
MSTMDTYFSFKFIQLQLSKMLMNNKIFHSSTVYLYIVHFSVVILDWLI